MILTCPSCSARYLLAADAIGANGRTVRCGKCAHVWQQPAMRDSLDDLVAADFTPPVEDFPAQDPEPVPEAALVKEFPVYKTVEPAKEPASSAFLHNLSKHLPRLGGIAGAIAVFAFLTITIIMARAPIMSSFPSTQPLFAALGFEEGIIVKNLIFDSITAKISERELGVSGKLINLSDKEVTLPPMTVEILDAAGTVVTTYPAGIEQKNLKGEESIDFEFAYKDVPETGKQVRLIFKSTTDAEGVDNIPVHSEAD